jgi:hypothetical protein
MSRTRHVLHQNTRITGNVFSHMRCDHACVNVEQIAGLATGDYRNRLALIIGRLRGSTAARRDDNYKQEKNCSSHL